MARRTPVSGTLFMDELINEQFPGTVRYVDGTSGDDNNDGLSWDTAHETVQGAVTDASARDRLLIAPGFYDEAVTIPRAKSNLQLVGMGGRGSVGIEPSTVNATGLTIHADDITLQNVGTAGDGTGHALVNTGRRTRLRACKVEGGTDGIRLTLGTVAQIAANTHGKGDDFLAEDCEFAYNTNGAKLVCTDYGAVTQARFSKSVFHDNSAADFEEAVGTGGSAAVLYRSLDISECEFRRLEDGSEPAKYILLNDDNGNKGVVSGCRFPTALNGGKNLVSTGLIWTGNFMTGGLSTGQPS